MYAGDPREPNSLDLSDYWRVVRRRRWVILTGIAVGALLAALYTTISPPAYRAEASVLVRPVAVSVAQSSLRADQLVNLATEREIIRSSAVANRAADLMGIDAQAVQRSLDRLRVIIPEGAQILVIEYEAGTPEAAMTGAQAFADAYLEHRGEGAVNDLAERSREIQASLAEAQAELVAATGTLVRSGEDSVDRALAQAEINLISARLSDLQRDQANLRQVEVDPGEVIVPASLPAAPTSQPAWLVVAIGAVVTGILSLPLAFARERLDDRLWEAADVESLEIAPVLGVVPAPPEKHTPGSRRRVSEPYRRLSLNLASSTTGAVGARFALTPVTGAERNSSVVSELAIATAQMGRPTLLIGTDEDHPSLADSLGFAERPGLGEILSGEATINRVVRNVEATPQLRVVVEGLPWHGDIAWERLSRVFDDLAGPDDVVLVHTAPALETADALRVSALMDGVLIVAHRRRTTKTDLTRAAAELAQSGAKLLGIVLVAGRETTRG